MLTTVVFIMGLLDVFRPRWKHSNPDIRLEAVRLLDDDEALAQSASRDIDERIRRLAIKQLIDPWRLQNVAGVQTDDKLRLMALGRARELFVQIALSAQETERSALAAVRDLDSQEHLADIALKATRAAVRTQALDLVVSKGALVSIVRKSANADLRRAAVARITDSESLKQLACQERDPQFAGLLLDRLRQAEIAYVAQKAKHKPVAKLARQRAHLDEAEAQSAKADAPLPGKTFDQGKTVDLEALKRNARQFQLAREFEALAERAAVGGAEDGHRAEAMQAEWAQIGADAEETVGVRIHRAIDRWNRVYQAAAQAQRKLEQKQAAVRAAAKARELTERMSAPDLQRGNREEAANTPTAPSEGLATPAAPGLEVADAPKTDSPDLTPQMLQAELETLETLKNQLLVTSQSDRLRLLDAGLKELRNADRRIGRLPDDKRDVLQAEFADLKAALTKRLAEVKQSEEWKRWVNVQRLEKLCVQVEVLRDVLPEFPDKEQAPAELATLRQAWRQSVGPVHPAKRDELWQRFRAACDAVMAIVVKSRPAPEVSTQEAATTAQSEQTPAPEQPVGPDHNTPVPEVPVTPDQQTPAPEDSSTVMVAEALAAQVATEVKPSSEASAMASQEGHTPT